MKEWQPEETILIITNVLLESEFAASTDMTEEEAIDLANLIVKKLEQGSES